MIITKLGHCCLLIETGGRRILTDPGNYSTIQNTVQGIDIILIAHEHSDHLHLESLKIIVQSNKNAVIFTNQGVGAILEKENIQYILLRHGQERNILGIQINGFGEKHALIYPGWKEVENTGFFIQNRLFYPGDSLCDPKIPVEILALPVAGPWLTIKDSIDFCVALAPRIAFPVHDGMFTPIAKAHHIVPQKMLAERNIDFRILEAGGILNL